MKKPEQIDAFSDPSYNVSQLMAAAMNRQDDLREAESRRIDEQMKIRSEFSEKLREAEAKRIDAIRAVDVNAVAVATSKQADQATVLATQVSQSAEALRALVASTAITTQNAFTSAMAAFSERLMKVEQAQYEGIGRGRVLDPQIETLIQEIRTQSGSRSGMSQMWGWIVSAIIAIGVIATLIIRLN